MDGADVLRVSAQAQESGTGSGPWIESVAGLELHCIVVLMLARLGGFVGHVLTSSHLTSQAGVPPVLSVWPCDRLLLGVV